MNIILVTSIVCLLLTLVLFVIDNYVLRVLIDKYKRLLKAEEEKKEKKQGGIE